MRHIEIVACRNVQILDVAGPLQVFTSANEMQPLGGEAPYRIRVVAGDAPVTMSSAGLGLATELLSASGVPVDTLVVAGGSDMAAEAIADRHLVDWLKERARSARRVASVCTGAFLLAEAGLLEGRRAVTHWSRCGELAERYPATRVEPDPIFVRDGPIWSSAGITAGIDLALALVEEDIGKPLALAVARELVVFLKRPGGQSQFSTALGIQAGEDRFAALHDWIKANLARGLPLSELAARAGMSERSFSRRYVEASGMTPARMVERLRVEEAKRLFSDTRLSGKQITRRCGFGTEETMRRAFGRHVGATPQEYRVRFSGSTVSSPPA